MVVRISNLYVWMERYINSNVRSEENIQKRAFYYINWFTSEIASHVSTVRYFTT